MAQQVKQDPDLAQPPVKKDETEQEVRAQEDLEQVEKKQQRETEQLLKKQSVEEAEGPKPTTTPTPEPHADDDLIEKLRHLAKSSVDVLDDVQRGTTAMAALVNSEVKLSMLGAQRLLWLMPMLALFAFSALMLVNVGLAYLVWTWTNSTGLAITVIVLSQVATCAILVVKTRHTINNMSFPRTRAQLHRISTRVLG